MLYSSLTILFDTIETKPLELGADLVLHSGTKFLTGHNDILAGVIIAKEVSLGERLTYLANSTGPTLSSFDCWLFIRSLKTLPLRFERQEQNAKEIAAFFKTPASNQRCTVSWCRRYDQSSVKGGSESPFILKELSNFYIC